MSADVTPKGFVLGPRGSRTQGIPEERKPEAETNFDADSNVDLAFVGGKGE